MPPVYFIAMGGGVVFLLLLFQISLGMRWIKIKGPRHWKVHKAVAFTILTLAAFHMLGALAYIGIIPGWPN